MATRKNLDIYNGNDTGVHVWVWDDVKKKHRSYCNLTESTIKRLRWITLINSEGHKMTGSVYDDAVRVSLQNYD